MGTGWTLEGSVSLPDQGKTGLRILVVEDQAATAATLASISTVLNLNIRKGSARSAGQK